MIAFYHLHSNTPFSLTTTRSSSFETRFTSLLSNFFVHFFEVKRFPHKHIRDRDSESEMGKGGR